jgi:hypothetical protein
VVFYLLAGVACATSGAVAAQRSPSPRAVLVVMVLSNAAFAVTSTFFGALLFAPALVAVNTTAFVAHVARPHRALVIGCGCAAVLVPAALELVHVGPSAYAFSEAGMTIVPRALSFPPGPTFAALLVMAVGMVLTSSLSVLRIRGALTDAERQLMLYAWHLRELVPTQARDATDPTVARRGA